MGEIMGQGLKHILRMYGRTKLNDVYWVWDYANEKPMLEKEMTKEMRMASEKTRVKIMKEASNG